MKIKMSQLRQIIKEAIAEAVEEGAEKTRYSGSELLDDAVLNSLSRKTIQSIINRKDAFTNAELGPRLATFDPPEGEPVTWPQSVSYPGKTAVRSSPITVDWESADQYRMVKDLAIKTAPKKELSGRTSGQKRYWDEVLAGKRFPG